MADDISIENCLHHAMNEVNIFISTNFGNKYLQNLKNSSGLKLLQEVLVRKAFAEKGVRGLFRLFLNDSWFEFMRMWTNLALENDGLHKVG